MVECGNGSYRTKQDGILPHLQKWDKRAGEYLKTSFYSHGAAKGMDSLMRSGTGEPLTPRYLIHFLQNSSEQVSFQNRTAGARKKAVE